MVNIALSTVISFYLLEHSVQSKWHRKWISTCLSGKLGLWVKMSRAPNILIDSYSKIEQENPVYWTLFTLQGQFWLWQGIGIWWFKWILLDIYFGKLKTLLEIIITKINISIGQDFIIPFQRYLVLNKLCTLHMCIQIFHIKLIITRLVLL